MTTQRVRLSPVEAALAVTADPTLLRLCAQPLVDTDSASVAGYELLARFPEEWQVGPFEVFAAAEGHGLGPGLTCAVLGKALALRDTLPPRTFLTVNCSPADVASADVLGVLEAADLHRVFVEFTESEWPADEAGVLRAAATIRRRDGRIAADDVGAGYAGLLQLIRLRPEMVKIDREIVQRVEHDQAAVALIAMLGSLVGRLDGWLVAEGVETLAQLESVVRLGVPLVQGYHLGRPGPPWGDAPGAEALTQMQHRLALREHLVAYRRSPREGELVLDHRQAVVGIVVDSGYGEPVVVQPLLMAPSTTVTEAVLRVMARRTPLERIAPVVLTDKHGRSLGVAPVERLVESLAAGD